MYRGNVSIFSNLCFARRHVQRACFWHLKSIFFSGTRLGPPLFEVLGPLHGRSVWLWCMWLDWNKVISGKILEDLKRSLRKSPDSAWQGPIFRPLQKGNVFQKGPKSGPSWNQKWPLLAGPFFAPSLAQMCWRLAGPCVRKCLFECNQHLRLRILNWGGPHSRLQFFFLFQVQKIDPSFWQVFPLAQESKRP